MTFWRTVYLRHDTSVGAGFHMLRRVSHWRDNPLPVMSNSPKGTAQKQEPAGGATMIGRIFGAFLTAGALMTTAAAQTWPSRPVTSIVPFAAGNANDITARIVFEQMSKQIGQPIVIESRPGAGGTIGVGQAARATPDGYTILF